MDRHTPVSPPGSGGRPAVVQTLPTDTVALVTGSSKNIGRAVAVELARAGAAVVLNGRREEPLAAIVEEIIEEGGSASAVEADVTVEADVARLVDGTVERYGRIDILVNNVGAYSYTGLLDLTLEQWEQVIRSNLTSAFLCTKACVPHMIPRRGQIFNIGAGPVVTPRPRHDWEAYLAGKGGLMGFSRGLVGSLESKGIRTTIIHPYWTVDENQITDETRQMACGDIGKLVVALACLPPRVHIRELVVGAEAAPFLPRL